MSTKTEQFISDVVVVVVFVCFSVFTSFIQFITKQYI